MTKNTLTSYIKHIYILEKSLYEQRYLLSEMKRNINLLSNIRMANEKDIYGIDLGEIAGGIFLPIVFGVMGIVIGAVCGFFSPVVGYILGLEGFTWGRTIVVCGVIGFLLGIILDIFSIWDHIQTNKENTEYNKEIKRQYRTEKNEADQKLVPLRKAFDYQQRLYDQTKKTLDDYYALNIIFPKYRNYVAVTSFLEYLMSGRCSSLEGHEGAYNIYENEIRLNLILTKLDDIIYHLDQIEQNQYMLYRAIKDSNDYIRTISASMNQSLANIEKNTEISAYNSEISAQNAEYIKWLVAFRY